MEELESWAISGEQEAQESLAELYAEPGPLRDPSKAYFWFHIAFSFKGNGYSTEFRNKEKSPLYCGPVGDFRNEAQVCELVDELGLAQIQLIDQEARAWLQAFQDSLDVQS
ncbi:hypothetical protein [Botrimarina mediterranea]|uniref:Uncharacterized protein n=2 Tax=Botrimarina mediterranea TaxID=2528022 RepID=A0A518KDC3_9BACT|nr:hypothetical protein Spa11_40170 [Botrimarina mediterranea]QDV80391.1 hypothetical protein K2D_40200 [Planctomycetes bacterium K2D]